MTASAKEARLGRGNKASKKGGAKRLVRKKNKEKKKKRKKKSRECDCKGKKGPGHDAVIGGGISIRRVQTWRMGDKGRRG